MANHITPALRADNPYSLPVKSDRFARENQRSQRTQPLMRRFEIASLLSCGRARTSHHLAPATKTFEATCAAFARGTLISAPTGPIAIEDLLPGDIIDTVDSGPQRVIWIGSTTYIPAQASPTSSLTSLIRFLPDGYDGRTAMGDLLLGPSARLLQTRVALEQSLGVKSVLTPARDFEDGHRAFLITPPSPVRLFHIRTGEHASIYANGRCVETYHPGRGVADEMGDATRSLFLSLFPDISDLDDFGALKYPRMSRETLESLIGR